MSDEDIQEPINLEAAEPNQEIEHAADDAEAREPEEGQPDEAGVEEVATDDTEGEDAETEDQSDEDDGSGEEETPEDGDAELVDVEFEGKEYKLPVELKEALMKERDYRHKTNEIAREKEQLAEMRQTVEQVSKLTQDEQIARANLANINQQLEQFGSVDWNAWEDQDPVAAQRGFRDFQLLKDRQGQLSQAIQQTGQQRAAAMQEELGKRVAATQAHAAKSIPGWNAEIDRKIGEFAKNRMQVDDAWMAQNLTPQVYEMAHLAYVGAQSLERAKAKPKAAKVAKPKPTSKVSGKGVAPPRRVEEIDDMEAYARTRRKQMGM